MDIKDFKQIMRDSVKNDHKTNLKDLLEKENKGLILPSWGLKTGSIDLENLSYHDGSRGPT